MLRIFGPALAVLALWTTIPAHAAQDVSQRKMIDKTCTTYQGEVHRPKLGYMTKGDQHRLKSEQRLLTVARMVHSDLNTYYKAMSGGAVEAPVLNMVRSSKRLGNKGCMPIPR